MSKKKVRHITLTEKDLNKIKLDITQRVMVLVTAFLMDDLDYNEDRIIEVWDGITRYADAIDRQKLITINKIIEIIEEKTGLKLGKWE